MNVTGQEFLDGLSGFPPRTFESNFSRISTRLGLGAVLTGAELDLLLKAAFGAALCNIAFNGQGGCGGRIKPSRERNRRKLEIEFMTARDRFQASPGWKKLPKWQRSSVEQVFLRVSVNEKHLAA